MSSFLIRSLTVVVAGLACLGSVAHAKTEINKETLDLITVLDIQKTQDATIYRLVDSQAATNPVIQKHRATYLKFMQETVGWEAIKPKVVAIWQASFTKEEMKELTAFYKTPVGKKAVRVMPDIVAKASQIGQDAVKDRLPELQKRIEAEDKKSDSKKK